MSDPDEDDFNVKRYLKKLEAERTREHDKLALARVKKAREREAKQLRAERRAKELQEREERRRTRDEDLQAARAIRREIKDLKHSRTMIEDELCSESRTKAILAKARSLRICHGCHFHVHHCCCC